MKKKVLKVVAGASLMMAMAVGVQMSKSSNANSTILGNIQNIAMGDDGEGGSCIKYCCSGSSSSCMGSTKVDGTVYKSVNCDEYCQSF